jgi:arylsulfatase A-like enzyme/putative intracellular protease/amidase
VTTAPDIVILLTDEERAAPPYETEDLRAWRERRLPATGWFAQHGVSFRRHYTGSLACVPSRPTLFTGHYPDVHGVTQTDGLAKTAGDARMRWLPTGEVPTLGSWLRAAGYDTHYDGKWHISHADLVDPSTGRPLATNTADGTVLPDAVRAYLDADPLAPHGFSGWVGPEPHGADMANCGLRRDPLLADRTVAWLSDRYARRAAGDPDALRPFLLVASFVNPHDIVLFPAWARRSPLSPSPLDPPDVPASPTDDEDLRDKPAAQAAFRAAYPTAYGPPAVIERIYRRNAQAYRNLYLRLHAEAESHLERVRRAVVDAATSETVLVRTSDHGELLGAHGGLHQKWFNLYDEATRIPFYLARVGGRPLPARTVAEPTSHVDLVPTLLAAAGVDVDAVAAELRTSFTEVHPLPGRDLLAAAEPDTDAGRAVYLMTRDNVLEGDTPASGFARRLGREDPPAPLRITVPAHAGSSFEGIVARVEEVPAGAGHLWKLVRTFDDPDTWTSPTVRHLAANGLGGVQIRRIALPDAWELYDLDDDPIELHNLAGRTDLADLREHLVARLAQERRRCVPPRNAPWPYLTDSALTVARHRPPPPARALRRLARRAGLHPEGGTPVTRDLAGRRALIVATNHGELEPGRPTGVFASELTVPYYLFLDAGMTVDVASPAGGAIPVDPLSLRPVVRSPSDDRYLADEELRAALAASLPIGEVDVASYDLLLLAGGWGAAFDFATSPELADAVTTAVSADLLIGGICHGPLGLLGAKSPDGSPWLRGRRVTAVTDKQVRELRITSTPFHPESELRRHGALFESRSRIRDPLANHWVVDGTLVTGQNQNAGPMVAHELMGMLAAR